MDWWFFGGKRGLTVMLDLMQRHARADATVMPDLIGHLSMTTEKQKRHLTWAEMPLKCFEIHMNGNCKAKLRIKMIPARINRKRRTKRVFSCYIDKR